MLNDASVLANGRIAWHDHGCYRLQWGEGEKPRCVSITHALTKTSAVVPDHVHITQQYHMESNWNDLGAIVTLHPDKYTLAAFFADGEGPHSISVWASRSKNVTAAAAAAATSIASFRKMASAGEHVQVKDGFFKDVVKQRRQEAAAKARQLLDKKKLEMTSKRRIALTSPPAKVVKKRTS